MKTSWFKRESLLTAVAVVAVGMSGNASAVVKCATWGCGSVDSVKVLPTSDQVVGKSRDILTDGYCVYQRIRKNGQSWPGSSIPNSKACTTAWKIYTFLATSPYLLYTGGVRLYREDGRYMTLWGS